MLSTPHLLVGAAIAHAVSEPTIALPLAFMSHFVLDATPHWDGSPHAPFSKKVIGAVVADYAFGMTLIYALTLGNSNQPIVLAGAFLATLPDFIMAFSKHIESPIIKLPFVKAFNHYHSHIQFNVKLFQGFLTGVATSIAAIVFLVR